MPLFLDDALRASGELENAGHIEACIAVMVGFKERNASGMVHRDSLSDHSVSSLYPLKHVRQCQPIFY
jgi:hypothetical protein